jgi:hypothetical protein
VFFGQGKDVDDYTKKVWIKILIQRPETKLTTFEPVRAI